MQILVPASVPSSRGASAAACGGKLCPRFSPLHFHVFSHVADLRMMALVRLYVCGGAFGVESLQQKACLCASLTGSFGQLHCVRGPDVELCGAVRSKGKGAKRSGSPCKILQAMIFCRLAHGKPWRQCSSAQSSAFLWLPLQTTSALPKREKTWLHDPSCCHVETV